jgi:phosphohistidine phosphatase
MKLYVMRHGPAEDHAPTGRDSDRALTPSGRDRVRSVARVLVEQDEAPLTIFSSPLVRALQTAEIVAAVTKLDERVRNSEAAHVGGATGAVEIRRELAPGGDAHELAFQAARDGRKRVMIVGHEPDLSSLVARLIGRMPDEGMMKAMVVGVKLAPGAPDVQGPDFVATNRFVLQPKTLELTRG